MAGAFGGVSGGTGVDGMIYSGVSAALTGFGCNANQGSSRPAAYLNYILFDKDYKVLDAGWQLAPATTGIKQLLSFPTKTVKEEGYVFVWLSYDNASNQWVYFDDFKVTHTRSNVIQYNEYYPFGLQTSASWTRDNNSNNFLYNAANELNKTTGWYDTFFRGYDPSLGRFMQIDPLAQLYADETPYHYAGNNPVLFNDPLGDKVSGGNMFARMYDGFHAWKYGHSAEGFASWMDDAGFAGFGGEATGKGYFIGRPVEEIWMVSRYKNEDGSAGDIIDEYFDHYVYEGESGLQDVTGKFWRQLVETLGGIQTQGEGAPVIFVSFDGSPKGFDKKAYMSSLNAALIANGFDGGTQVMEYSLTNKAIAWWNNSPTGTIALTTRYGDMPADAGGYAHRNDPNSIVVYWGLSGTSILGQAGIDSYVDASLHEIGHAFFGFKHDKMGNGLGISGSAPSVMDYRYAYQGIGFNAQELQVVGSSIYGGH